MGYSYNDKEYAMSMDDMLEYGMLDRPKNKEKEAPSPASNGLTLSSPSDQLEKEADAFADGIVGGLGPKEAAGMATNETLPQGFEAKLLATRGNGAKLPQSFQKKIVEKTGEDLSSVRVHTDDEAASLSQEIGAKAFTYGQDIYGPEENLDPTKAESEHTLAHEVGHTIQHSEGRVGNTIQREVDPKAFADQYFARKSENRYTWEALKQHLGSDGSREQDLMVLQYLLDSKPTWNDILAMNGDVIAPMLSTTELPQMKVGSTSFTPSETDLIAIESHKVEYALKNDIPLFMEKREEKRAEASKNITDLLNGKSTQLNELVSDVLASKGKVKSQIGAGIDQLRDKVIQAANEKFQQVQTHTNEVVVTAALARFNARDYYLGSNQVIDNNTKKEQARLDQLYHDARGVVYATRSKQDASIDSKYKACIAEMEKIAKKYENSANDFRKEKDLEYRKDKEHSGARAVSDAIHTVKNDEIDAMTSLPFMDKRAGKSMASESLDSLASLYKAASLNLVVSADANKASAKALREEDDAHIDALEIQLLAALEDALQTSYAQLNYFLNDAIQKLETFYNEASGNITNKANASLGDAQNQLNALAAGENGQDRPDKKELQEKLETMEASTQPLVDDARNTLNQDIIALEDASNMFLANTTLEFEALHESSSQTIANICAAGIGVLATEQAENTADQLELREKHLNQIIYDINRTRKNFDAELAGLETRYQKQLDDLDVVLANKLLAFEDLIRQVARDELIHQEVIDAKVQYLENIRLESIKKRGATEWYEPKWTWLMGPACGAVENMLEMWDAVPTQNKIANAPENLAGEIATLKASKDDWSWWNLLDSSGVLGGFWRNYNIGYYMQLQSMDPVDYVLASDRGVRAITQKDYYSGILGGILPGIGSWFTELWDLVTTIGGLLWDAVTWQASLLEEAINGPDPNAEPGVFQQMLTWFKDPANESVLEELFKIYRQGGVPDLLGSILEGPAQEMGGASAKNTMEYYMKPYYDQGYEVGKVIGYMIPELLTLVFSDAIVQAFKFGLKGLKFILKWVVKGVRFVGDALSVVRKNVVWIEDLVIALKGNAQFADLSKMLEKMLVSVEKWADPPGPNAGVVDGVTVIDDAAVLDKADDVKLLDNTKATNEVDNVGIADNLDDGKALDEAIGSPAIHAKIAEMKGSAVQRGFMNSSDELMGVEKASDELIAAVSKKRKVIIAKEGSEDFRYLEYMGAEANVGGEFLEHILLRENPSKAAILEEFLHGTQKKLGIIDEIGEYAAEAHVKDFMIRHQKILGLLDEDILILKKLMELGL